MDKDTFDLTYYLRLSRSFGLRQKSTMLAMVDSPYRIKQEDLVWEDAASECWLVWMERVIEQTPMRWKMATISLDCDGNALKAIIATRATAQDTEVLFFDPPIPLDAAKFVVIATLDRLGWT